LHIFYEGPAIAFKLQGPKEQWSGPAWPSETLSS